MIEADKKLRRRISHWAELYFLKSKSKILVEDLRQKYANIDKTENVACCKYLDISWKTIFSFVFVL